MAARQVLPLQEPDRASGERSLWRAVLEQAVTDATSKADNNKARLERSRARQWIADAGTSFRYVCALAELDHDLVQREALKLIDEADASPVRVGKPKPEQQQKQAQTYTFNGETLTIHQWAKRTGLSPDLIRARIVNGWSIARAVTEPLNLRRSLHSSRRQARRRGVGLNLPECLGTGGGSIAQESAETDFSTYQESEPCP